MIGGTGLNRRPVAEVNVNHQERIINHTHDTVIVKQDDGTTTGWTTGGTSSFDSSGVLTLSDSSAHATRASDIVGQGKYAISCVFNCVTTNSFNIHLRNAANSADVLKFVFDSDDQDITETVTAGGNPTTPANIDMTSDVRVLIVVDRLARTAICAVQYYYASGASTVGKQLTVLTDSYSFSTDPVVVRFRTESGGTGDAVIRDIRIFEPTIMQIGSSFLAGSGSSPDQYTPYPGFKGADEDRENTPAHHLETIAGGDIWIPNFATGGHTTAYVKNTRTDIIALGFPWVITDLGCTNSVDGSVDLETLKADIVTIVSAYQSAGIRLVVQGVAPRDDWDAAKIADATEINAYLEGISNKYKFRFFNIYDDFEDPDNPGDLHPLLSSDETHPNHMGHKFMANKYAELL